MWWKLLIGWLIGVAIILLWNRGATRLGKQWEADRGLDGEDGPSS